MRYCWEILCLLSLAFLHFSSSLSMYTSSLRGKINSTESVKCVWHESFVCHNVFPSCYVFKRKNMHVTIASTYRVVLCQKCEKQNDIIVLKKKFKPRKCSKTFKTIYISKSSGLDTCPSSQRRKRQWHNIPSFEKRFIFC